MEMMKRPEGVTYARLTEDLPSELMGRVDLIPDGQDVIVLDDQERMWHDRGVVYLPKFLPEDLMEAYKNLWQRRNGEIGRMGGWPYDTPYLHHKALRDIALYKPLMEIMKKLVGGTMGLHLNLTGWVTTNRDFHSDSFLNPPFVGARYVAAWMALGDIHPDSGPFEFIPGSHRWPVIRQEKLFQFLTPEQRANPAWPAFTQEWVADLCLEESRKRKAMVEIYTPRAGDVLLWHSQLVHRGSPAKIPGMERRALISHYSSLESRRDMPRRAQHDNGEWYFVFDHKDK